jgi:hypothetical protein
MNETVFVIAVTFASIIGSPLVQGLKALYLLLAKKELEGQPALRLTVGTSFVLAGLAMVAGGVFNPPYPATFFEWVKLVGGSVGAIFSVATVVFKELIKPAVDRAAIKALQARWTNPGEGENQ